MDATSALLDGVLQLYTGPLEGVQFPQVDPDSLRAHQAQWQAAQAQVAEAEAALQRALEEVQEARHVVTQHAQRALAYARVFADGEPELLESIDALAGSPKRRGQELAPEGTEPKRRGRPRKVQSESLPTELEPEAVTASADEPADAPQAALDPTG